MGPRSDERGNSNGPCGGIGKRKMLQWGRARMSAEINIGPPVLPPASSLQWGRARMSAEMDGGNTASCANPFRFNGAALG